MPRVFFYKSSTESELFIDNEYLVIYRNSKLYYLQKIDDKSNIQEIKLYLEKSLNFKNYETIEDNEIILNKKHAHTFIKLLKSNLFNYFLIYLLLLCLGFYSFDFIKKEESSEFKNLQISTAKLKKDIEFKFISEELISLYVKAKKYDLKISSISFKDSKFILNLESKNKKSIYTLLEEIKNSNIDNLLFNEKKKRYTAYASFKIYRR